MTNLPVVLSNIRIHGVGEVIDTQWFEVGNGLTNFLLPEDFNRHGFLQAIQTVNPPYDCHEEQPFGNYPLINRQGKYQKRVRPHRRTIAFAIFSAESEVVLRLSKITPDLYETDRIEVGRRMDYSRWINFVEIASSTRWSEVDTKVMRLLADFPGSAGAELEDTLISLRQTDRVKDELREELNSWLSALLAQINQEIQRKELEDLQFVIQRQLHFIQAKNTIKSLLPTFHIINKATFVNSTQDFEMQPDLGKIKGYINSLLKNNQIERNTNPVLLFDGPSLTLDHTTQKELLLFLKEHSAQCHSFYLQNDTDAVECAADKVVTLTDMLTKKRVAK